MPLVIDDAQTTTLWVQDIDTVTVAATGSIVLQDDGTTGGSSCIHVYTQSSILIYGLVQAFGSHDGISLSGNYTINIGSNPEAKLIGGWSGVNANYGSTIDNAGLISGRVYGIFGGSYGPVTVTNSGVIEATGTSLGAIHTRGERSTATLTVTNSGVIQSKKTAVVSGLANDVVVNTGRIETTEDTFAINLKGGNDLYDGRNGGSVVGEIDLGDGNDTFFGGSGAEIVIGGKGSDTLDGGAGDNVAAFSGARADYSITSNGDGSFNVIDLRFGQDGNDLLKNIKFARFSDKTIAFEQEFPSPPPNLVLVGTKLADRLVGGAGNDMLYGKLGKDWLDGRGGVDIFVFDTRPSKTNIDTIQNFSIATDKFWLDNKYFKKLGKKGSEASPAKLNKAFFKVSDKAQDRDDYLIHNKNKGILYYDPDGSGAAKQVEFAKIGKNAKLTYKDFFVI